ncbi:putative capsular polysaccharide synthesis family protein [Lacunimicrobium album]
MHFLRQHRIRRRARRALLRDIRRERSIILIYQPGKVASSTIAQTLSQYPQFSIWQLHSLIPDMIHRLIKTQLSAGMKPTKCLMQGEVIREELLIHKRAPFRVITLVREPIARNVSAFFERFSEFFPGRSPLDVSDQQLDDVFQNKFDHHAIVNWFDDDFYRALGVDLYTASFHKENRYAVMSHPHCDVLVLRTDLPDFRKIAAISLFLGMEETPEVIQANVAELKVYKDVYKRFASRIRLNDDLCEELLNSRYARHFYTEQERQQAMARWSIGAAGAGDSQRRKAA